MQPTGERLLELLESRLDNVVSRAGLVQGALQNARAFETRWLSVNAAERTATVVAAPDAGSAPFSVAVQLVVEFYSQRV